MADRDAKTYTKPGKVQPQFLQEPIDENEIKRYSELDRKRESISRTYQEQQENIMRSVLLREEISKGVKDGEDMQALLLKAIECISRMTGDQVFFKQNNERLRVRKA